MTRQPDSILPPHNAEAEEAVLGSLLIEPAALPKVTSFLRTEHFYIIKNGWTFDAIRACGESADLFTVAAELARRGVLEECGGQSYLNSLPESTATALNVVRYARMVEEYAVRRAGIQACSEIARLHFDQTVPIDSVLTARQRILDGAYKPQTRNAIKPASAYVDTFLADLERRHDDPLAAAGTPTGFVDIDRLLGGGFHAGESIIIAARPGMGKSSYLLSMAANLCGLGTYRPPRIYNVAFYSLEMVGDELINRLAAMMTGVDSQRVRAAQLNEDEWAAVSMACMKIHDAPLYINDMPQSVDSMAEDAERLHLRIGLDLIICDYLGLFNESGDAYERTTRIARGLKNVAKELKVPLVCASQLSRACEARQDKTPVLSDLRDSGEVEQAADVVQFIYRDEYYNGNTEYKNIANIITAKQRNGPTGICQLYFDKRLTLFKSLALRTVQL